MEGKVEGKGRRKKWHSKLIISFKNVYSGEMTGKPFFSVDVARCCALKIALCEVSRFLLEMLNFLYVFYIL